MRDLSAARSKLERAHQHIYNFEREKAAFLATEPYTFIAQFDPESNITTYQCGALPAFPVSLSLLIGDTVHALRTALDYIINALVIETGATPGIVYFPIAKTVGEYPTESRRKTKGVPDWARRKIDAMKPYEGGDNLLWGIHELDRIDKHRLLVAVSTVGASMTFNSAESFSAKSLAYIRNMKPGYTFAEIYGRPETHQGIKFSFDVALGEPVALAGEAISKTLSDMAFRVAGILTTFEA